MSFGVRDIRNLYPRITENHLRYLEKWGLIRPAPVRGAGEFSFNEVATIRQLAAELEKSVPLKHALRALMADHQGQLLLDFHAAHAAPAKVVTLPAPHERRPPPESRAVPVVTGNAFPFSDPQAALAAKYF